MKILQMDWYRQLNTVSQNCVENYVFTGLRVAMRCAAVAIRSAHLWKRLWQFAAYCQIDAMGLRPGKRSRKTTAFTQKTVNMAMSSPRLSKANPR